MTRQLRVSSRSSPSSWGWCDARVSTDPNAIIAGFMRDGIRLDLKTVDLCFLAGLYLRADRAALASFEEDVLVDLFEQVCDLVEPGAENPRKRATHAIQRLREQRMLARVDGTALVRAGEYALTRLAAAIVEYFLADEKLTRESLTLLTGTLKSQLAGVLAAARKATSEASWREHVLGPLRVTVADLVAGIERRQRGLDQQQEEVQAEIARLLQTDWFAAIDRCQDLLDATTRTLQELNEILLRDTHHFVALLQDLQTRAQDADQPDAEAAAQRVIEHVDRIGAWGSARQRVWSEYYQHVHGFLRDVVRLDPGRALSQRLRDQLVGWESQAFRLNVADERAVRLLRALEQRVERTPVVRPRVDREPAVTEVPAGDAIDSVAERVQAALDGGAGDLASITRTVLDALAPPVRYAAAGHVATAVARIARVEVARERPWTAAREDLEVENWTLLGRREAARRRKGR